VRLPSRLCMAAIALMLIIVGVVFVSDARADGGLIGFRVIKGGWIIGASGGSGTLYFHGRSYPVSIGGLSAGFLFGGSATDFRGTVSNIRSPYDVTGIYGAAGGGAALGVGGQAIVLRNEKGAVLTLTGMQIGLQINADLSGLSVTVR
jgi:hypothetical protein